MSFVVGSYGIINYHSPQNTGRLVELVEHMGVKDLGEFGVLPVWKIKPITKQPLSTKRTQYPGKILQTVFFLPETWLFPITIEDKELDMFLLMWAQDEKYYRSDVDPYGE